MTMLNTTQLKEIAKQVHAWEYGMNPISWGDYTTPLVREYEGPVVPKERPRRGKSGVFYTPEATRKAEAGIKNWALNAGFHPVTYPIRVIINVREKTDDPMLRLHSIGGITFNTKGDVDNFGKLICDALNGIAYRDDRQIMSLIVNRRWAMREGFKISIERGGLNKSEYTILKKLV